MAEDVYSIQSVSESGLMSELVFNSSNSIVFLVNYTKKVSRLIIKVIKNVLFFAYCVQQVYFSTV